MLIPPCASSKTLSTQYAAHVDSNTMPYELIDIIVGLTIGQAIHDTVEVSQHGASIAISLCSCWKSIGILAGVSTAFRSVTLKLVALAFRIPLPCESRRMFPEAAKELRSLLLYKAATCAGAAMDPPAWEAPLLQAYGYYLRARFVPRGYRAVGSSVVSLHGRSRSEMLLALRLCGGTLEGLSHSLVDALYDRLQEADSE
ncbi:hypothetical protein C8R46DRAFT_1064294 [Mycena filopes]|nr:hypothetical protein C8R46DRAFT_1064294 [Mycena filopes]